MVTCSMQIDIVNNTCYQTFFLMSMSSHNALVMQSLDVIRSTCAAFRLIVVFFFNTHCNIVVVVVIAVFVRFQSVFSRKTNSFLIQTIGSCMHMMSRVFLVWFVVVLLLLLLQTAHDGRRRHHCFFLSRTSKLVSFNFFECLHSCLCIVCVRQPKKLPKIGRTLAYLTLFNVIWWSLRELMI